MTTDQLSLFASTDTRSLRQIAVEDPLILVLATGRTDADVNRNRGELFEEFFSTLLTRLGFEAGEATTNVKQDGVEIDIATRHRLTSAPAMVECKAYSTPLPAHMLSSFYGKLSLARIREPNTFGLFVGVPRPTADGLSFVRGLASDKKFRCLDARQVAELLEHEALTARAPNRDALLSDLAVVVTANGVFSAAKELDPQTRSARVIRVWSATGDVPDPVLRLVSSSSYAAGLQAATFSSGVHLSALSSSRTRDPAVVPVAGGNSDFEYQLPASPKFFVGRADMLTDVERLIATCSRGSTLVLNAQSGWGKSSLALRLAALFEEQDGVGYVVDTRTATTPDYVWAVLRAAALHCQDEGVLRLPANASYASLASCLRTLASADWQDNRPLLLFFDQFENVFRDHVLAAEFRDLALAIREVEKPIVLGFAWKTDFVGWTEEFPYHLRDDIRGGAIVLNLTPFGPRDIGTLVGRLERTAQQKISPDLQERLREYSGGLPWLFKKLASHMLQQLSLGVTQDRLASEALNAQALFESDLAELSASERGALHAIARQAPVPFDEIRDAVPPPVVQSLLNRRLIVQVGERIDTYWDVFRDFLNTGRVPIEDTYVLRQTPQAVSRLLRTALENGGQMLVAHAAALLNTSEPGVFNLSRDLRLLGVLSYAPGEIKLVDEVRAATDVEETLRALALRTLRRHRVFRLLEELWSSNDGEIGVAEFADALRVAFPAVGAGAKTWRTYARAFATWFEYVHLAAIDRGGMIRPASAAPKPIAVLASVRRARPDASFPASAPGPALTVLRRLRDPNAPAPTTERALKHALRDLEFLGAVITGRDGNVQLADEELVDTSGNINARQLRLLIEKVPGGVAALTALEQEPATSPQIIGRLLAEACGAQWSPTTIATAGKHFRGWARQAGVVTRPRSSGRQPVSGDT